MRTFRFCAALEKLWTSPLLLAQGKLTTESALIERDSTKPTAIICTVSHRPLPCGWVHSAKVSSRYATHPMTAKAPVCGSFKISSFFSRV